jgi:hypothetical protein
MMQNDLDFDSLKNMPSGSKKNRVVGDSDMNENEDAADEGRFLSLDENVVEVDHEIRFPTFEYHTTQQEADH